MAIFNSAIFNSAIFNDGTGQAAVAVLHTTVTPTQHQVTAGVTAHQTTQPLTRH